MASVVDICNLALGHLGDAAEVISIDPLDGSAQAAHCARYYPIARRMIQEMHAWNFNTRRVSLALLATDPPLSWDYRYARPSGCIRTLAVLAEDSADGDDTELYIEESLSDGTQCILTNVENATLRYLVEVTDTTKYSALCVDALSKMLASRLAGPILKGQRGVDAAIKWEGLAVAAIGTATKADASSQHNQTIESHVAPWVSDR